MYIIREAQEHHRNVELHLYRKICLLLSTFKFEKKVRRMHLLANPGASSATLYLPLSSLFFDAMDGGRQKTMRSMTDRLMDWRTVLLSINLEFDRGMDGWTNGRTDPIIEMQGRI